MKGSAIRPWQGTTLGVFACIGLFFLLGFGLVALLAQGFIGTLLESSMGEGSEIAAGLIQGGAIIIGVILLLLAVVYLFMARGIFKGQKWAVIVYLVITALSLLSVLLRLPHVSILGFGINGFLLYLEIMCLKSPYYNPGTNMKLSI